MTVLDSVVHECARQAAEAAVLLIAGGAFGSWVGQ